MNRNIIIISSPTSTWRPHPLNEFLKNFHDFIQIRQNSQFFEFWNYVLRFLDLWSIAVDDIGRL